MQFPEKEFTSFVVMTHEFHAIRIMGDRITPVKFTLKLSLMPVAGPGISPQLMGAKAGLGFHKLKAWLDSIMYDVIIMNHHSPLSDSIEEHMENVTLYTPGEPDDFILSAILHSKVTQLIKGHLELDILSITSSDTFGVERYYRCTDGQYGLPGIEYVGEEAVHTVPWWQREGLDTVDFPKSKVENTEELLAVLAESNKAFEDAINGITADDIEEAEIVVVDTWKKGDK
jgi:hypothetical protein